MGRTREPGALCHTEEEDVSEGNRKSATLKERQGHHVQLNMGGVERQKPGVSNGV